jgi:hypothetical protein
LISWMRINLGQKASRSRPITSIAGEAPVVEEDGEPG